MKENQNTDTKPKQIKRIPNIPKKPQKGSKFNIFWVYAAIIVGLLVVNFMFNNNEVKTISYKDFEEKMLIPGDVKQLVGYKSSDGETYTAEIYIKDAKKSDPKYKAYINSNALNMSKNAPVAKIILTDSKELRDKLEKSQVNVPKDQQIDVSASSKSSPWLSGFITIVLPLLLFAGLWIFMMRRMGGGGGGGGGQIFNIGKSKATLFDKESQVSITFNDVAGLEEAKQEVGMVIESIDNIEVAHELGKLYNIEMPIVEAVYGILYEGLKAEDAVNLLMNRAKKSEN